MRRKDREILSNERIDEIINSCEYCRLGFYDGAEVYIVPMNFGYEKQNGQRTFYFHCAKEGRKIDIIAENNRVGLELDAGYRLNSGEKACDYSAAFQSIIGSGSIFIVNDKVEKIKGMRSIMRQCTGKEDWELDDKLMDITCILRLVIDKISCKEHL